MSSSEAVEDEVEVVVVEENKFMFGNVLGLGMLLVVVVATFVGGEMSVGFKFNVDGIVVVIVVG